MSSEDRADGYVTDATYPDKFFRELSPVWLGYVAALAGVAAPDTAGAFHYLELGAGLGHSLIANAGAFPRAEFHACDVNPEHVAGARRHAAAFGVGNVRFHEASFEELLRRELPQFQFIVLHGVYSWVGAPARAAIRALLARRLAPGGIAYVSYNCQPGWASELPLRRILIELAATADGGSAERSAAALAALRELSAAEPRYLAANPEARAAIDAYGRNPSSYLAHEFMNAAWEPFYSIDVADELAPLGLSRIGSATLADNHLSLIADERMRDALGRLPSARQRELALDFAVNRRFRRDVFVRGAAEGTPTEVVRRLSAQPFGGAADPAALPARVRVPRGDLRFGDEFVAALRALLARGSLTLGAAAAELGGAQRDPAEILRNLVYLIAAGALQPFARARQIERPRGRLGFASDTVERAVRYVALHRETRAVPSTVLGNGVEIDPPAAERMLAAVEVEHAADPLVATWLRLGLLA